MAVRPPQRILFLPGASGNTAFWQPVADRLPPTVDKLFVGWPGFGPTPADPRVQDLAGLVDVVLAQMDRPCALVAQSMGGVVAMHAALRRPEWVTQLVLTVTSAGVDMAGMGAQDWRPAFYAANPAAPRWLGEVREDLSDALRTVRVPALLLWGDADPISPLAVGERLASLLPNAQLHVIRGGDHNLAHTFAAEVAPLIERHLFQLQAQLSGFGEPTTDGVG